MKKILSVLLVFVMLFSFAACGGSGAKDALDSGLTALKKFDTKGIEKYFVDGSIDENDLAAAEVEVVKTLLSTFSWKIESCIEDGDKATASVELSCVSMAAIVTELMADMLSGAISADITEEEAIELMSEKMKDSKTERVTETIEVTLEKIDGQWKISNPETVVAIVYSGLEGLAQ